jgi:long-chain acyl-CoA synthetase
LSKDELERFRQRIAKAVAGLPGHKRPAGALVLCRMFSPDTGELTANLKLRRLAIADRYGSAIEALYQALDSGKLHGSETIAHNSTTFLVRL